MQSRTPIPAHAAIDRFMHRVLSEQAAWVVAGEGGLGRVASPTRNGRETTLVWSQVVEAGQWGPLVAEHPRLKRLSLADLFIDVLPRLAELGRLVGPDHHPLVALRHRQRTYCREVGRRRTLRGHDHVEDVLHGASSRVVVERDVGPGGGCTDCV